MEIKNINAKDDYKLMKELVTRITQDEKFKKKFKEMATSFIYLDRKCDDEEMNNHLINLYG